MITLFAHAGGLLGRADLPIPDWLFGWAAAMVLFVSFVALAVLWPEPKLERDRWRPLPGGAGRVIASRPVEIVCGLLGVAMLGVVVYTRLPRDPEPGGELRADVRVRELLGRAGAPERAVRRRLPGVQPLARDRPRAGWTASRVARGGCRRRCATRSGSGTGPPRRGCSPS